MLGAGGVRGVSGGMRGYRQRGRKVGAGVYVCFPVCVCLGFLLTHTHTHARARVCKSGITECISGPKID